MPPARLPQQTVLTIPPPPEDPGRLALTVATIDLAGWHRISQWATGEPYFGRHASGRFDDPRDETRFGVCYLGQTFTVALAEAVVRDQQMDAGGAVRIAWSEIERRHYYRATGGTVRLADLRGAALRRLGLSAAFIACQDYRLTQPWAVAIHDHPSQLDGVLYQSRQVPDRAAVALFERARARLALSGPTALAAHPHLAAASGALAVRWLPL